VALRPLHPEDAPAVEPWLAEAVAAVDGDRPTAATPASIRVFREVTADRWPGAAIDVIIIDGHGVNGLLVWRMRSTSSKEGAVVEIDALAIRAGLRNRGYGAEAVLCLEAAHPSATMLAAVPRLNGLAIYFWLRIGYRPVRLDEDATLARDDERLWMVRGFNPSGTVWSPAR
jgi:GNAT superfamily N-acetyltransferase